MRSWMIAFSLGILLGGMIPGSPDPDYLPLCFIPIILSLRFSALRLLAAYGLGLFWVLYWAVNSLAQILPAELERKDFWVRGEVASLPEVGTINTRFVFEVTGSCLGVRPDCGFNQGLLHKQSILLSLYEKYQLKPGQHWQFKVRLKRPHGFVNPGAFDYEAWLWQQGVRASGYVRSDSENQLLQENSAPGFEQLRYQFSKKLDQLFPAGSLQHINLLKALSIGDKQGISNDEWFLFSLSGTNHLMVISGMHVGFVAMLIYSLSHFIIRRLGNLCLYLPAPRLAALIAVFAAYLYAGISGFGLPAQRAFLMLAVFMLAQGCCRHSHVSNSYCLALTLVLLINPLAPVSSGFWLSFAAVAVLVFFVINPEQQASLLRTPLSNLRLLLKTQLFIFMGLLPFMLLFFQQSSLVAPFINLLAIPYITLLLVPLCLLTLFLSFYLPSGVLVYLCYCAERLFECFMLGLEKITQHWPLAVVELPALAAWQWLFMLLAVFSLLYALKKYRFLKVHALVVLILPLLLLLFRLTENRPRINEFQLHILDVGQGLAIVIRTREHVLLYDLGPAYSEEFNAGEGIMLPFLRAQNIRQIDTVIISHGDNDHSGGLLPLLQAFPQAKYLSSDISLFPNEYNSRLCRAGQEWYWDGINFEILHPDRSGYNSNNSSCVLRVSNAFYSALLPGDIEARVERRLLSSNIDLAADILIAPHHGSKTSSHKGFIKAVSPNYVIFSSGYLNQFNHPHPDIVNLYTNSGTIDLNTAETGTISWLISNDANQPEVLLYRQVNKRFWRTLL